ncbi:MAG: nitroreductase family protein [Pseudomonadota bacterium]
MTTTPENPVIDALVSRRTVKVFAPEGSAPTGALTREQMDKWVDAAGNAPFHKPSHPDHDAHRDVRAREPWRVTKLDAAACQAAVSKMEIDGLEPGKLGEMIRGAEGIALVSFLPNPAETQLRENEDFEASFDNMEIIASAGAFCQSLLLAAESDGYRSYWSSGGDMRKPWGAEYFGRPEGEVIIGALFFFPAKTPEEAGEGTGGLADKRAPLEAWSSWFG